MESAAANIEPNAERASESERKESREVSSGDSTLRFSLPVPVLASDKHVEQACEDEARASTRVDPQLAAAMRVAGTLAAGGDNFGGGADTAGAPGMRMCDGKMHPSYVGKAEQSLTAVNFSSAARSRENRLGVRAGVRGTPGAALDPFPSACAVGDASGPAS